MIEIKIAYAALYELRGNHEKAISNLIEAMETASDENLIIQFVFNSNIINDITKDLLTEVYKIQVTTNTKISKEFISKLKFAIENKEKRKKIHAASELNPREIETLKLIAEDLMNKEIADKLFLSLNTVKTRLKNIFLKLEVDSRTKAVAKAKELGLF